MNAETEFAYCPKCEAAFYYDDSMANYVCAECGEWIAL